MKTILRIREIFWLIIVVLTTVFAIMQSKELGLGQAWYYFVPPVIASFMYTISRRQRIRNEKNNP